MIVSEPEAQHDHNTQEKANCVNLLTLTACKACENQQWPKSLLLKGCTNRVYKKKISSQCWEDSTISIAGVAMHCVNSPFPLLSEPFKTVPSNPSREGEGWLTWHFAVPAILTGPPCLWLLIPIQHLPFGSSPTSIRIFLLCYYHTRHIMFCNQSISQKPLLAYDMQTYKGKAKKEEKTNNT